MDFILNDQQIRKLVAANNYKIDEKTRFIARCIDGRYQNSPNLPALAIPGGDAGELAAVFAACFSYGLEYDKKKVFKALCSIVGGVSNLRMHIDDHVKDREFSEDMKFIEKKLDLSVEDGAEKSVLHGKHEEVAVFLVAGKYGIFPQCKLDANGGVRNTVDERHKKLADLLAQNKAVILPKGCDEEYLYSAISETTENHLMETLNKLAKGLAIYQISFEDNGNFSIEKIGKA